ncbi:MAG: hypothetical protein L6Q72_19320 [Burkholderiaceae bacterium]|nr:hypothetical protein [Burkholderiaceae bacterium]
MNTLTKRDQDIDERAMADAARLHAICIDCIARLSAIQAEAGWTMLAQPLLPPSRGVDPAHSMRTAPRDELLYFVGEAYRVVVEAQSQLRLLLEQPLDDVPAAPARRASRRVPRAARTH